MPKPVPAIAPDRLADAFKADAGDRVFFAAGSATLGARARVALETQAAWLLKHTYVAAVVEGHADDPGDDETNLALAQARAETVRDRLAQLGVPEGRLAIASYGRAGQVVTCQDPACAAPNRRVVLRIARPQPPAEPARDSGDRSEDRLPPQPDGDARARSGLAADPRPDPASAAVPGVRPGLRRLF